MWRISAVTFIFGILIAAPNQLAANEWLRQTLAKQQAKFQNCGISDRVALKIDPDLGLFVYATRTSGPYEAQRKAKCVLSPFGQTKPHIAVAGKKTSLLPQSPIPKSPVLYESRFAGKSGFLIDGTRLLVFLAPMGEGGVSNIIDSKEGFLVVSVQTSTHARNYLIANNLHSASYLSDGDIKIVSSKKRIFRALDKKSYWREGGAFWFDALIDEKGTILDIEGSKHTCLPKEGFIKRSGMKLDGVEREMICFEQ